MNFRPLHDRLVLRRAVGGVEVEDAHLVGRPDRVYRIPGTDHAIRNKANDYLTHRLLVAYPVTDKLTAQLNVQNLTDKKYYTAIRNNGWATPGDGRSAVFSIIYSF